MIPVVCYGFVLIVVLASPDADTKRGPILRSCLDCPLLRPPPFVTHIINVKSGAFGMPFEQCHEGHPISFRPQRHFNRGDGADAILIDRRTTCEQDESGDPPHASMLAGLKPTSMPADYP